MLRPIELLQGHQSALMSCIPASFFAVSSRTSTQRNPGGASFIGSPLPPCSLSRGRVSVMALLTPQRIAVARKYHEISKPSTLAASDHMKTDAIARVSSISIDSPLEVSDRNQVSGEGA